MTTAVSDRELDERRQIVGEIEKLTVAHEKALPGLDAAVGAAAARVERVKGVLKDAVVAHQAARFASADAANRFSRRRDILEGRLRDSAAPEIDQLLREFQVEEARLMVSGNSAPVAARQVRVTAIRAARLQVEEMKLLPLSHDELVERLREIREGAVGEVVA